MSDHIVVLDAGFTFTGGTVATATVFGDQSGDGFKTNPTRKRGTVVAEDFPTLLRQLADVYEQEGSWEAVAALIRGASSERADRLNREVAP